MSERLGSDAALRAEVRAEVRGIADRVRDAKVAFSDDHAGWIGYASNEATPSFHVRKGIYRGQLGVALFLAAVDAVDAPDATPDERCLPAADDALAPLFETDADELVADLDLGAGNGVGSLLYGLAVLGELTGERRYHDRAGALAETLTDDRLAADDHDVLYGTAGALHGLLALYERTDDDAVLDRAVACGERLVEDRYGKWGYGVWDTLRGDDRQSISTGMGRGVAGIAYALYRLYGHTGQDAFREVADDALGFENVFYSREHHNWKANWLAAPAYPRWWCYGVAGVGLARLGSRQYHDGDVLLRDLDRAASFEPGLAESDQLCHGTFSQVAFLTELGRERDDSTAAERARDLATDALERKRAEGGYRVPGEDGVYNPGLFLGTAGVGYALLRLLAPDELPCILRFE